MTGVGRSLNIRYYGWTILAIATLSPGAGNRPVEWSVSGGDIKGEGNRPPALGQ